jgi:hypothetical protein
MSKIIAKNHFESQKWEVTFENLSNSYADLYIGFTDIEPIVKFKNLKVKYELKKNENIIQSNSFPPPNIKYVQSDQEYLINERFYLEGNTTYELYLWAENDGMSFEKTTEFTTPEVISPPDYEVE